MKAKRLMHFCMVALMTSMLFSCNGCEDDAYGPEGVAYSVSLNFRDNTGADLVAGLKDHPDSYILNICPEGTRYPEIHKDKFSIYQSGSGYYVMDHTFFNGMEANHAYQYFKSLLTSCCVLYFIFNLTPNASAHASIISS